MPSWNMKGDSHASGNTLRNQVDSRLRACLSLLLSADSSVVGGVYGAERATRRMATAARSARTALIGFPRGNCRRLSRCGHAPVALTVRPRLWALDSPRCSRSRKPPCPSAPTPIRADESSVPRAFARRSSYTEARLRGASPTGKTTPRRSCPHHARVEKWRGKLAPAWTRNAPAPEIRAVRFPRRGPGRRGSAAAWPAPNRSGTWVLSWVSVAGLLSTLTALLAYVLGGCSGVPATAAELAGVTAWAAAARIVLAVPSAIRELRDLRPSRRKQT